MKPFCVFILISLFIGQDQLRTQSLEELLRPKGSVTTLSSGNADEAWKRVVTAFRANDTAKAVEEGNKFLSGNFTPSALQLLGVKVMLGLAGGATLGTTFENREDQEAWKTLEAERADITKIYYDQHTIIRKNDAIIQELTLNMRRAVQQGSSNHLAAIEAKRKADAAYEELERLKKPIEENKRAMSQLESRANNGIKPMTLKLLDGLIDAGEIEAAVAIASTYIRKIGNDMDVAMKQQNILRFQEASEKADKVIELLKKEVLPLLSARMYWQASDRQKRFAEKVESMTQDEYILRMVEAKISADPFEMERYKSAANKNSELILAWAKLDTKVATRELASFSKDYPDYPQLKELEFSVGKTSVMSKDTLLNKMEVEFEEIKKKFNPEKLQFKLVSQHEQTTKSSSLLGSSGSTMQSNEAVLAELGVAASDIRVVKAALQSLSAGLTVLEKSQMPEDRKTRLEVLKISVESLLGAVR